VTQKTKLIVLSNIHKMIQFILMVNKQG